ncbi:MAG: SDR family oxidoreductase [Gemmatimonadaceae bacterium]
MDPRVALVTGAGRRVGAEIAKALGGRGLAVAVHYRGSRQGAEETVARVVEAGGTAWAVDGDLADPAVPEQLVARVVERFGRLDILVNSAASMERTPFGHITVEAWDRIMSLNARAPFFLAQAAAAHMTDGGVIVNIADIAAFEIWPAYVPHGISKHAVVYATKALARLLAPKIRVNAIAPGVVLLPQGWDPALETRLSETTPLKHNGTPQDVVRSVLYLLDSPYVTGDVIVVDGGRLLR